MISLTELARLDAARTQGEWRCVAHDEDNNCDDDPHSIEASDIAPDVCARVLGSDGHAIVAAVNAMPALLRVARAARAVRAADGCGRARWAEACAELDAALAEVKP